MLAVCVGLTMVMFGAEGPGQPAFQSELIFPAQAKHVHGSSIVECPNGDLLACWFYGSGERSADDVLVQGARLKKGTTAWGPPFIMADTPGFPDCNPVLFIDVRERLWMFWVAVQANRWECSLLKYRTSQNYQEDGPPKWNWQDVINLKPGKEFADGLEQGFKELGAEEGIWGEYAHPYTRMLSEAAQDSIKRQMGWMTRIHPLALPDGRILLPLYSDGFNLSLIGISDDGGATWRSSRPIVGLGPTQPTLVRKADGAIVAYMRDEGAAPQRVQISVSKDNGESWSVARDTEIPNPSSSLEVIPLRDKRWVMVFNDTEDGRHSLALALSDDEGTTWKSKRHLERTEKDKGSFAYPSMIQTRDGLLHVTYSYSDAKGKAIKHVSLDPYWIVRGD